MNTEGGMAISERASMLVGEAIIQAIKFLVKTDGVTAEERKRVKQDAVIELERIATRANMLSES